MPTPAPRRRLYPGADPTMRQDMRTMHQQFLTYQKEFAALNPTFAAPFDKDWLLALDAADQAPPVFVRRGELRDDTQDVAAVMTQARAAVQRVFYYVGEAFPGRAGLLEKYGKSQYERASQDQARMRMLLDQTQQNATRDQKELAAKGYDKKQLALLGTLAAQLTSADTTQETTKGSNQDGTAAYIALQNAAYAYGQQVSKAAAQVFALDAAKLHLFRLGGSKARRAGLERRSTRLDAGRSKAILFQQPLAATSRLRLRLISSQPGQAASVGRATDQGKGKGTGTAPAPGVALTHAAPAQEVPAAALGPAGQYLVVHNTGAGSVRVEMTLLG